MPNKIHSSSKFLNFFFKKQISTKEKMELITNKTHVQEFNIRGENHQLLPPLTK
jgi:hypothetical protein